MNSTLSIADRDIEGGIKYGYKIYAYAGNNTSNSLAVEITPILNAQITTTDFSNLTLNTVTIGGNITKDGGAPVTERGICYSTSQNPTTSNNKVAVGNGIGIYSTIVTSLSPNTTYYFRSYAINSHGIAYGNEINLKTLPETVTDIDGNIYQKVTIGTQVWLKENLKVTKYRNGDIIGTTIETTLDISGENSPKYQWAYEGKESNATVYGRLYTWYTACDNRGLCPSGWHVPNTVDWTTLSDALGGQDVAGTKLKVIGNDYWAIPNTGTNESGFSALPGGYRSMDGASSDMGYNGYWWSSDQQDFYMAYLMHLTFIGSLVNIIDYCNKNEGLAVRCLKDD